MTDKYKLKSVIEAVNDNESKDSLKELEGGFIESLFEVLGEPIEVKESE